MKKALTWVMLGSATLMFGFSVFDVASGTKSTALWLNLLFWPLIIAICWWILAADKSGDDLEPEPVITKETQE